MIEPINKKYFVQKWHILIEFIITYSMVVKSTDYITFRGGD